MTNHNDDAIALDRARHYAGWVRYTVKNLQSEVGSLAHWAGQIKSKRPFITEYEDALNEAESEISFALEAVRLAREVYQNIGPGASPAVSGGVAGSQKGVLRPGPP